MRVKVPKVKCLRCGHQWVPNQPDVRMCPKCKSVRFDQPWPEGKDPRKQDADTETTTPDSHL